MAVLSLPPTSRLVMVDAVSLETVEAESLEDGTVPPTFSDSNSAVIRSRFELIMARPETHKKLAGKRNENVQDILTRAFLNGLELRLVLRFIHPPLTR